MKIKQELYFSVAAAAAVLCFYHTGFNHDSSTANMESNCRKVGDFPFSFVVFFFCFYFFLVVFSFLRACVCCVCAFHCSWSIRNGKLPKANQSNNMCFLFIHLRMTASTASMDDVYFVFRFFLSTSISFSIFCCRLFS